VLSPLQEALRTQVDVLQRSGSSVLTDASDPLYTAATLVRYYQTHTFSPVWITERGPRMHVHSLRAALRQAHRDGLTPDDYHVDALQELLTAVRNAPDPATRRDLLVDLELRATDAFLLYGMHLLTGRVHPERLTPSWNIQSRRADLVALLDTVASGQRVHQALDTLRPEHAEYRALVAASLRPEHAEYRTLVAAFRDYRQHVSKGGWPRVDEGPRLERDSTGERVAQLRERLAVTDSLNTVPDSVATVFDDDLHTAVQAFQERHGLDADGVVGPATLRALNVPAEERAEQIRLNLERWRWLPLAPTGSGRTPCAG